MFERGQDIKETLNLGKFSGISKKLREVTDQILDGTLTNWSNKRRASDLVYQVEPRDIEYKNIPDKGNVNKFYILMVLNDFSNYNEVKTLLKDHRGQFNYFAKEESCKIISMNFYIGPKFFKKAGLEYKENSCLVEINYAKLREK